MSTSDSQIKHDLPNSQEEFQHTQQELLRSIAVSLKAIHSSLEQLTGAVEGVAESIEKAHEPEGDLGVHLVNALKDLSTSLHKRAQQERAPQPQPRQQHPQQNRREDRPSQLLRMENRPRQDRPTRELEQAYAPAHQEENTHGHSDVTDNSPSGYDEAEPHFSESLDSEPASRPTPLGQQPDPLPRQRPHRNRRGPQGKAPRLQPPVTQEAASPPPSE